MSSIKTYQSEASLTYISRREEVPVLRSLSQQVRFGEIVRVQNVPIAE
jgi:hypothetical protein